MRETIITAHEAAWTPNLCQECSLVGPHLLKQSAQGAPFVPRGKGCPFYCFVKSHATLKQELLNSLFRDRIPRLYRDTQ